MNIKTETGTIIGIIAIIGGLLGLMGMQKPTVRPSPRTTEVRPLKKVGVKNFPIDSLATATGAETQPECDSVLIETRYNKIVGSVDAAGVEHDAKYDGDWAFPPDQLPTNTPCWKDWYQTAYYVDKEIVFETSATSPPTPRYGGNVIVWRLYFDKPATPTPTPTPTPLPYCVRGQRPGNPPTCICRNGYLGNSGKCQ